MNGDIKQIKKDYQENIISDIKILDLLIQKHETKINEYEKDLQYLNEYLKLLNKEIVEIQNTITFNNQKIKNIIEIIDRDISILKHDLKNTSNDKNILYEKLLMLYEHFIKLINSSIDKNDNKSLEYERLETLNEIKKINDLIDNDNNENIIINNLYTENLNIISILNSNKFKEDEFKIKYKIYQENKQ